MSVIEIILFVIGILFTLAGYTYNKIKETKKKVKIPDGYTEVIGICKKHSEKDGKFFEEFEIVQDDKKLKYKFPPQDDKEKLKAVDSIEKFYVKDGDVKHSNDFTEEAKTMDDKTKKICYGLMGSGLVLIIITLFMVLF